MRRRVEQNEDGLLEFESLLKSEKIRRLSPYQSILPQALALVASNAHTMWTSTMIPPSLCSSYAIFSNSGIANTRLDPYYPQGTKKLLTNAASARP